MQEEKIVSGSTVEEVWRQLESDFQKNPELLQYKAVFEPQNRKVDFVLDVDLGGGFEGGYAYTSFTAQLTRFDDFRFSMHHQDFVDEIGKVFGAQDVTVGDEHFDSKVMVKANNEERVKDILTSNPLKEVLQSLAEFKFHIVHAHSSNTEVESAYLELRIDDAVTEPDVLHRIYDAFVEVLNKIDPQ
jgi:hypothetical protein